MKNILETKAILLVLLVILLGYLINFIALDVVINDTLWEQHLNEKYNKKYDEYKEFDLDLSEFEDELNEFEQQNVEEDSYDLDTFYIDTLSVVTPFLVVVLGFSCLLLLLFLFHGTLNKIKYLIIFKITSLSYLLFYVPDIISNLKFLVFDRNYEIKDIQKFNGYFKTSSFFEKESLPDWLWTTITDFNLIYILFPALIAVLIKIVYKQFSINLLLIYTYLTYFIAFVFYEIIMWYIFGF